MLINLFSVFMYTFIVLLLFKLKKTKTCFSYLFGKTMIKVQRWKNLILLTYKMLQEKEILLKGSGFLLDHY